MIDRRGHRKLKLTSRKHSKLKPKQVCAVEQPQEVQPPGLEISFPIAAYTDAPVSTVNNLQDRLKSHGTIPSGIGWKLTLTTVISCLHRMDR